MHGLTTSILAGVVFAGAYLALAGSLDGVELAFVLACAVPAAALVWAMSRVARRHFALRVPARALLRPLGSLLPDAVAVGRELVAASLHGSGTQRGGFVRQPFDSGDGQAATHRATVLIGLSLAPRTFVVRGENSDELLLHVLPERAASPDHVWPA